MASHEDHTTASHEDHTTASHEDHTTAVREPPATPGSPALARRPDLTSLVAGIALIALGVLLVLESEDVLDLSLSYLWPALLAAAGAVLLASGLRRRRAA